MGVISMCALSETIIAGFMIFVTGQIFLKWIIEPVHQLKKTIADITHTHVRYAHLIHNPQIIPPELHQTAHDKLRQLSGQLYGDMALIPLYSLLRWFFWLPTKKNVYRSAQHLIATANWMNVRSGDQFHRIIKNIHGPR